MTSTPSEHGLEPMLSTSELAAYLGVAPQAVAAEQRATHGEPVVQVLSDAAPVVGAEVDEEVRVDGRPAELALAGVLVGA